MKPGESDVIRITHAREHNLREVSLTLPKNQLICFTGVSGSGKSSLAFDTLYAEGQRRYIESLSSYARQFVGEMPKPDVDQITGLAPSISIQQKTSGWNPRSTVGTITQVHDYLRVLFARAGVAHCPQCGKPIASQTREQMAAQVLALGDGVRFSLLAPKVRAQKGEFRDLFDELVRQGYVRARVDGEVIDLASPPELDRYRRHDIEVVVDRLVNGPGVRARLTEALELALSIGEGLAIVAIEPPRSNSTNAAPAEMNDDNAPRGVRRRKKSAALPESEPKAAPTDILLSSGYACATCGLSFEPPSPQLFSFNSPQGMCSQCDGLGSRFDFDPKLLIPDTTLEFLAPCVKALRTKPGRWRRHIYEGVAKRLGFDLETPWRELPKKARDALLYGTGDLHITFEWRSRQGSWKHGGTFEGVIEELRSKYKAASSSLMRSFYEQYMRQTPCPGCAGARLNPQALAVRLSGRSAPEDAPRALNIHEACTLPISRAAQFFSSLELDGVRALIAEEPLKEILARLRFLLDVGLDYLTLDRAAPTLSGGESQRIRLASQIGCGLVGVLYVLDEPSIGLHPRDNRRLLESLLRLRDVGNTVVVVEHDEDTMQAADLIVDFGPGAGVRGGEIVALGSLDEVRQAPRSVTGAFLSGRERIEIPDRRPVAPPPDDAPAAKSAGKTRSKSARTPRVSTGKGAARDKTASRRPAPDDED